MQGRHRSKLRRLPTMERLSFNRSSGALNSPVTGAAAHMSLHLNQQCQRADALPTPFPGYRSYRSVRRERSRPERSPPRRRTAIYGGDFRPSTAVFRNFPKKLSKQEGVGRSPAFPCQKPYGEQRTARQVLLIKSFFSDFSPLLQAGRSDPMPRWAAIWEGRNHPSTAILRNLRVPLP